MLELGWWAAKNNGRSLQPKGGVGRRWLAINLDSGLVVVIDDDVELWSLGRRR